MTYILLAVVLLIGAGGILAWKFSGKAATPAPPVASSVVTMASSAPTNALIDEVPLPLPVVDAAPTATQVVSGGVAADPCSYTVCTGEVAPGSDTERGLQVLARQSRRKCYDPALGNDPSLQGHVKVRMKIAGTGQICSATVSSNDMSNTSVGDCAARMLLASGHVPSPRGGCVNLDFPISYVPMGQH